MERRGAIRGAHRQKLWPMHWQAAYLQQSIAQHQALRMHRCLPYMGL